MTYGRCHLMRPERLGDVQYRFKIRRMTDQEKLSAFRLTTMPVGRHTFRYNRFKLYIQITRCPPLASRYAALRYPVGAVLLLAAGLKAYGLLQGVMPTHGWLSLPSAQIAVVTAEMLLAVWLLSGVAAGAAWLTAVLTFSTFAAYSTYLGYLGVASCGCFGAVTVSPWVAFLIDTVVLGCLLIRRPNLTTVRVDIVQMSRPVVAVSLVVAVITTLLAGIGTLVFGSVPATFAYLRGQSLSCPTQLDLGTGKPGDRLEYSVAVTNHSSRAVTLIGGTSDCSCLTTGALPITIPPGGTTSFPIRLKIPTKAVGVMTRNATVFTDDANQPVIGFQLACYVVADATGTDVEQPQTVEGGR